MSQANSSTAPLPTQDWTWPETDPEEPRFDWHGEIPFLGESTPAGVPAIQTGGTPDQVSDPIGYVVSECISGRFADWSTEALGGWLLMHGIDYRAAAVVIRHIGTAREALAMAAAGYEPAWQARPLVVQLPIALGEVWS